ncbi:MAG: 1,2-phenylacetyl-CoA epoxidase subunit PaaD [Micromonosporaceae bacterium]
MPDAPEGIVAAVPDPELPFVTIAELGILREVSVEDTGRVVVTITPTYSGCPAMATIRTDIRRALAAAGHTDVEVRTRLAPAWTTDRISESGRRKLAGAGIAPPGPSPTAGPSGPKATAGPVAVSLSVRCPQCGSPETEEISRFGSTSCKALWRCRACTEPFDHFKAL